MEEASLSFFTFGFFWRPGPPLFPPNRPFLALYIHTSIHHFTIVTRKVDQVSRNKSLGKRFSSSILGGVQSFQGVPKKGRTLMSSGCGVRASRDILDSLIGLNKRKRKAWAWKWVCVLEMEKF